MRTRIDGTPDVEFGEYLTRYFAGKTIRSISVDDHEEKRYRVVIELEGDQGIEFRCEPKPYEGTPPLWKTDDDGCRHEIGMSWR